MVKDKLHKAVQRIQAKFKINKWYPILLAILSFLLTIYIQCPLYNKCQILIFNICKLPIPILIFLPLLLILGLLNCKTALLSIRKLFTYSLKWDNMINCCITLAFILITPWFIDCCYTLIFTTYNGNEFLRGILSGLSLLCCLTYLPLCITDPYKKYDIRDYEKVITAFSVGRDGINNMNIELFLKILGRINEENLLSENTKETSGLTGLKEIYIIPSESLLSARINLEEFKNNDGKGTHAPHMKPLQNILKELDIKEDLIPNIEKTIVQLAQNCNEALENIYIENNSSQRTTRNQERLSVFFSAIVNQIIMAKKMETEQEMDLDPNTSIKVHITHPINYDSFSDAFRYIYYKAKDITKGKDNALFYISPGTSITSAAMGCCAIENERKIIYVPQNRRETTTEPQSNLPIFLDPNTIEMKEFISNQQN